VSSKRRRDTPLHLLVPKRLQPLIVGL
jgi:hypothetical protein